VQTLCGDTCGPLSFKFSDPVEVVVEGNPQANATITKLNAFDCPGQWVIHEVDSYLYVPVKDPTQAAGPALDLSYALGGQWDTYPVVRKQRNGGN